jgi:hypothetical protein
MKFLLIGLFLLTGNSLAEPNPEIPENKTVYINPATGKMIEPTELIEGPPVRNVDTIFPADSSIKEPLQYKPKRIFKKNTSNIIYESDIDPTLEEINEN